MQSDSMGASSSHNIEQDEDMDDDDDSDYEDFVVPRVPPPLPVFKTIARRPIQNINDILEEPGRSHRQDK